tara:strand:+ start:7610 stop:8119 length:510 start_codon:yes stop_codon:yes gene_type:complete
MKIKERPEFKAKQDPLAMSADTNVDDALKEMNARHFGSVVVINDNRNVVGIVTERDLVIKVLGKHKAPESLKLSDIMTKNVRTAHDDDNVVEWLRIMSNERFRHLPVVNSNDQLVSVMSQGDFVSYTWPNLIATMGEKTRHTLGRYYEIVLIAAAMLIYALVVNILLVP